MAEFALINENESKNPQSFYPAKDDQSSGQIMPNKVNTGQTRGDQTIQGRLLITDETNVVRMVAGFDKGKF